MRVGGATPAEIRRPREERRLREVEKAVNLRSWGRRGKDSAFGGARRIAGIRGRPNQMNFIVFFVQRAAVALVLAFGILAVPGVPEFASRTAEAAVVSSIVVTGNKRVEAATIRNYVLIVPGKSFGAVDIDESVKALYGTSLFSDVTISINGSRLVVAVVENPIVSTVIIRGNKKVKSDALVPLLQTKSRGVYTDAKVQADVQQITEYYATQGRSLASVEPEVTQLADNRVDIVFVISEGARTGVGTITFVGNRAFSDNRLRSVITTRQHNLLSWLNRKDIFNEGKLAADQDALRRFYMSHGYADFRVVAVDWDLNEARGRYHVTFTIEEGPRYRFSSVNIDSTIPGVNSTQLLRYVTTRSGRTFNATAVEKSVEALTIQLAREGYAFAQVRPRGDRDYENHTISITYLIDEGPRVYVERIDIIGNTKTRDYVIRREFDISEGDAYNRVMVDRAERRLRDLGYFKTVSITTEPGSTPDRVIVVVQVQEESTGEFAIGACISTAGLIGEVSMNERNFLGRGQQLRISAGFGVDEQTYNISFTDPYFLGYRVSAGVDAYKTVLSDSSYRPFDSDTIGGGLRLGLPITDNLTVKLNYQLSQQTISSTKASTALYFPDGDTLTSAAGYGIDFSTLDSRTDPHDGFLLTFNQSFAGLGGDVNHIRSTGEARYFREIIPDADIVGALRVGGGNITGWGGKSVRVLDDFFQGGETIRGFATYGYGPVDAATGIPVGGKNYWVTSAEVQFPLPGISPEFGFRGALFADAGSLWGVDVPAGAGPVIDSNVVRSSVGASILWSSPVGVLRADFSHVLSKASTDDTQFFRFSAGKTF